MTLYNYHARFTSGKEARGVREVDRDLEGAADSIFMALLDNNRGDSILHLVVDGQEMIDNTGYHSD